LKFTKAKSISATIAMLASATFAVVVAATPASASGAVWVSQSGAVSGTGRSCTKPGASTIQDGIDEASAMGLANVNVCSGTYTEQLTITNSVKIVAKGAVTLQLPAAPANSTQSCDTDVAQGASPQDAVDICTSGTVSLTGFAIHANWPSSTCNDDLYGIFVGGGATLKASSTSVTAAGAVPLNGCQGGVGIQIGSPPANASGPGSGPAQVGHAVINNSSVSGYQKNGIDVQAANSTATISNSTVTGIGPTDQIAQNGIQISDDALGKVTKSVVSGNECDHAGCGPDALNQTQSAGVLILDAAPKTSVNGSTISNNDMAVYTWNDTAPTTSVATISNNQITNNRYAGVMLDAGFTTVNGNTISFSSGDIDAIVLLQYAGAGGAVHGKATKDTIMGTAHAVHVVSDQDSLDTPGSFTITHSSFDGGGVFNDNPTAFTVNQSGNT
jgi:parallel beta-helix repeat protein